MRELRALWALVELGIFGGVGSGFGTGRALMTAASSGRSTEARILKTMMDRWTKVRMTLKHGEAEFLLTSCCCY